MMVKYLQNLELSVLVSLVLQHLLDGYSLASASSVPKIHRAESPLARNTIDLIFVYWLNGGLRSRFYIVFARLCFHVATLRLLRV